MRADTSVDLAVTRCEQQIGRLVVDASDLSYLLALVRTLRAQQLTAEQAQAALERMAGRAVPSATLAIAMDKLQTLAYPPA